MKTLAISMLNWNSIGDTVNCINSLNKSNFQNFDIYLLDNGSNNNEFEKLKEFYKNQENIIINYFQENIGFTGGNNYNLNLILKEKYKYALLLNNDTIIPNDFLGSFINKIEIMEYGGIFGPEIRNNDNTIQSIGNKINLYTGSSIRYKSYDKNNKIDYVSGSCFLIKYDILEKIGIIDNKFFAYYEESDYCLRVKKAGFGIYIIPNTYIYHKEKNANKKDKPYYCYLMFRNRILFLKKHCNYLQYSISYLFLIGYLLLIFPKNFGFKKYKYALIGIWHGIKGIGGKFNI